jgi:hypothetical protein
MKVWFSRERIDKWGRLQYYWSMGNSKQYKNSSIQIDHRSFNQHELFSAYHTMTPEQISTDNIQENIIQTCANYPESFERDINLCMRTLIPYLHFPIEYELALTNTVVEANRLDKTSYMPVVRVDDNGNHRTVLLYNHQVKWLKPLNSISVLWRDKKWKTTIELQYKFSHDHYIGLLRKAIKQYPFLYKYGFPLMWMLLSRKWTFDKNRSKTKNALSEQEKEIIRKKQRDNIKKYYYNYVKERIANEREKAESATTWITKPLAPIVAWTSRAVATTLDIPSINSWSIIEERNFPIEQIREKPLKKSFNKKSLSSLFHQTWDTTLDNLLDNGREISDFVPNGMRAKLWYVILRKHDPDEWDYPAQYEFIQQKFEPIAKHISRIQW